MSEPTSHDPFADAVVWEPPSETPDGPNAAVALEPEPVAASVPSDDSLPSAPAEPGEDGAPVAEAAETPDEGELEEPPLLSKGEKRYAVLAKQRNEARQQANLAQQEAEYWKNRALQSPGTDAHPPPPPADGLQRDQHGRPLRPRQEQYATTGDYEQAMDVYEDAIDAWRLERAMVVAREQVRHETAVSQARHQFADYDQVVGQSRVQVNPAVSQALQASPQMHSLLYHIAKNPDLERSLAPLSGSQAYLAVARLELQLQQASAPAPSPSPDSPEPPPRLPAPPPPVQPTRAQGTVSAPLDYEKMSWEQFQEVRHKEQQRGRR